MARMGKKYLVIRRDGSIPRWPHFVLAGADPAAAAALRAYADEAEKRGMSSHYVRDVRSLADEFEAYAAVNPGDPGEPDNRRDCEMVYRLLGGA